MSLLVISSFAHIPIECSTLVICDIDDTVLHFPERDADCRKAAAGLYSSAPGTNTLTNSSAKEEDLRMLRNMYCAIKHPEHTDFAGFNDFLRRLEEHGGHMVFLTARSKSDEAFTRGHLNSVGIDAGKFQILFTDNATSKGEFIRVRFAPLGLPLNQWKSAVFIDDRLENIASVQQLCHGIKCYQFCV